MAGVGASATPELTPIEVYRIADPPTATRAEAKKMTLSTYLLYILVVLKRRLPRRTTARRGRPHNLSAGSSLR
jgi:hypothetical protein